MFIFYLDINCCWVMLTTFILYSKRCVSNKKYCSSVLIKSWISFYVQIQTNMVSFLSFCFVFFVFVFIIFLFLLFKIFNSFISFLFPFYCHLVHFHFLIFLIAFFSIIIVFFFSIFYRFLKQNQTKTTLPRADIADTLK